MIVAIDTSTGTCNLWIGQTAFTWEANRTLATGLLKFIEDSLSVEGSDFDAISGIVVMRGPGSFTGLRIGLTVMNTIAYANHIPIVGESGEGWRERGEKRLQNGADESIVLPLYGSEPNITKPKH